MRSLVAFCLHEDDVPLPFRKFDEDGSQAMSPAAAISGSGAAAVALGCTRCAPAPVAEPNATSAAKATAKTPRETLIPFPPNLPRSFPLRVYGRIRNASS